MPASRAVFTSRTMLSTDIWKLPGMEAMGFLTPLPGTTKRGYMKSSTDSFVSRIRRRKFSFFLNLLGR